MPRNIFFQQKGVVITALIIAFFVYCGWMLGPYLQSVFVRDAAVTSWSRVVTSPIDGQISSEMPNVATVVGKNGHVATVVNDRLFDRKVALNMLQSRLEHADVKVEEASGVLDGLVVLREQRASRAEKYAEVFLMEIATEITTTQSEIKTLERRISILERILKRQSDLRQRNTVADANVDEAELRLSELESTRSGLSSKLAYAKIRQEAAKDGVYIEADGSDPSWAQQTDYGLERHILEVRAKKRDAEQEVRELTALLAAEREDYARLSEAEIIVPSGAVIESIAVSPGQTVSAGDIVLRWVDCSVVLVDVAVSDAELPLIRLGMSARVILEGETQERNGTVMLTRGSAATIGREDLASIAKGRTEGMAQVIVSFDTFEMNDECPVGRAAYVGFPNVGLIDVIRARLRF